MHRTTRLAVAAAAALATTVTTTPAATADTVIRHERRGDAPRNVDLTRVVIDNGDTHPDRVIIRVRVAGTLQEGPEGGDVVTVWFNRDSDPAPDLRIASLVGWETEMTRVHRWNGSGRWADCGGGNVVPFRDGHGVKIKLSRNCLNHHPVKVAIRATDVDGQDWFRGRRNFLPGVRR